MVKDMKEMFERQNSEDVGKVIDIVKQRNMTNKEKKDDSLRNNDDSLKELYERQNNEMVRRKLDTKEIERDSVVKAKEEIVKEVNRKDKTCNSFKEEIDERLELIERSIIDTQNDSLTELIKKMKMLNTPLQTNRKRDITVLNTTALSDNEKTDRHVNNNICHKCKRYGHTKKQCDRHNKIVKQISQLEFEKDDSQKKNLRKI